MIDFTVYGNPKSKGSLRPFVNKKTGQALMTRGKSSSDWESLIRLEAQNHRTDECPFNKDTAVSMRILFSMQAPQSVKRDKPTTKPDLDKLQRAVLDALTGIMYVDDSQVVRIVSEKNYGVPSVHIMIDKLLD